MQRTEVIVSQAYDIIYPLSGKRADSVEVPDGMRLCSTFTRSNTELAISGSASLADELVALELTVIGGTYPEVSRHLHIGISQITSEQLIKY